MARKMTRAREARIAAREAENAAHDARRAAKQTERAAVNEQYRVIREAQEARERALRIAAGIETEQTPTIKNQKPGTWTCRNGRRHTLGRDCTCATGKTTNRLPNSHQ